MKRKILYGISIAFVILAAAAAIFPILFTFANSFMGGTEIIDRYASFVTETNGGDLFSESGMHFVRIGLIPDQFTLQQYKALLLNSPGYLRMFWNSVLLVVPVLIGQCLIAPLGAFAFEGIRWKYKEVLFFVYIIVMLMPMQILLVPNFIIAGVLGIRDSYLAIILPAMFHPLGVFLIRQQLKSFPKECMESARLDGAGEWRIFTKIIYPNLKSVIAALVVLLFADNWNIVDQAVIFIDGMYRKPLSMYLGTMVEGDPGMFFAVSVFYMVPALLVFLIGQDYLTRGISLSSLRS